MEVLFLLRTVVQLPRTGHVSCCLAIGVQVHAAGVTNADGSTAQGCWESLDLGCAGPTEIDPWCIIHIKPLQLCNPI